MTTMTISRRGFLAVTLGTVGLATNARAQRDNRSLGERYYIGTAQFLPGGLEYWAIKPPPTMARTAERAYRLQIYPEANEWRLLDEHDTLVARARIDATNACEPRLVVTDTNEREIARVVTKRGSRSPTESFAVIDDEIKGIVNRVPRVPYEVTLTTGSRELKMDGSSWQGQKRMPAGSSERARFEFKNRDGEVLIFGFKGTNPGNADYSSVEHRKPRVPEVVAIMVSHFMLELPARAGVNMMGTAGTVGFEITPSDGPFYPGGVRCEAKDR
jgi:hypothetical protein